jgi:hypothetical protein
VNAQQSLRQYPAGLGLYPSPGHHRPNDNWTGSHGPVLFCICRSSRAVAVSDKSDDATFGYMCFRRSLSDRFRTSAENVAPEENHDIPAARVFSMLAAVTGMHLKSQNQSEPFGPMVVSAEDAGQRHQAIFAGSRLLCCRRWRRAPNIRCCGHGWPMFPGCLSGNGRSCWWRPHISLR